MHESMPDRRPSFERRQSSRLGRAIPITVSGVDAVGQPFKERTTAVSVSCHGCRYQSRHYLESGSTVTLEIPNPDAAQPARIVPAVVRWVIRSKQVREPFQVNVALETPDNVWGLALTPKDWLPFFEQAEESEPEESEPESAPGETAAPVQPAAQAPPQGPAEPREFVVLSWPQEKAGMPVPAKEEASPAASVFLPSLPPLALPPGTAESGPLQQTPDRSVHPSPADEVRPQLDELASQAVKRAREDIAAAMAAAEAQWQERIEAKLTAADVHWQQRFQNALGTEVRGVAEKLREAAQATAERECQLVGRVADVEQSLTKATAEARQGIEALRASVKWEMEQAAFALAKIQSAEARIGERAALLEGTGKAVLEETERRLAARVAEQSAGLEQRVKDLLADLDARQAKALETTERDSVAHLVEQVEHKLAPRLERAERVAQQLATGSEKNEELLQAHTQQLHEVAEDALREAVPELEKAVDVLREQFQQAAQDTLRKWLTEADAKGTEVTHTTFEALYKASEWYQKKTQEALQAQLDKGVEDTRSRLREAAGEVSRLFAAELNHYSRSTIGHTRHSLEEATEELVTRTHQKLDEQARAVETHLGEQARRIEEQKLQQFVAAMRSALDDTSSQLVARVAQARQEWATEMASLMDAWQTERKTLHDKWLDALGVATGEAVQDYRQQLEQAADKALAAGLDTLRQRSQNVVDELSWSAEDHLREACSRIFAGVAESLRRAAPRSVPARGEKQDSP